MPDCRQGAREEKKFSILAEAIFVIVITIALTFITSGSLKQLVAFIPLAYFFIDKILRKRTWRDIGFSRKNILKDVANNWYFILVVAVVIPILLTLVTKESYPQLFEHIKNRLPLDMSKPDKLIITILAATFGEEIIFRALFQQRLNWFMKTPIAIAIASLVFGLIHYSAGNTTIVVFDILSVVVDGVFYGVIFARTNNVYVSWIAHFLADFIGLAVLFV
jgi:uncharacterized protein